MCMLYFVSFHRRTKRKGVNSVERMLFRRLVMCTAAVGIGTRRLLIEKSQSVSKQMLLARSLPVPPGGRPRVPLRTGGEQETSKMIRCLTASFEIGS